MLSADLKAESSLMPVYKDKDRGTWYAAFYYKDYSGKSKHKVKRGFSTKREASEFERKFLEQDSHKTDISFEALTEAYLKDISTRIKPTTLNTKTSIIDNYLIPAFGDRILTDIDIIDIRRWQSDMMKFRFSDGRPFSQTYLNTLQAQLSAIFNYAQKVYGLTYNPVKLAGTMGKSRAEEMNFWTLEEFEQAMSVENKPHMKLAFETMFWTGMRVGELLALTPADILPPGKIKVCKNFQVVDGQKLIMTPKTPRSKREISIPSSLYEALKSYIKTLGKYLKDDDRLFFFTKQALEHEMTRISEKSGVKKIRIHDLRHSHAALCRYLGIPIDVLSRRLGHESIKTTIDTYGHLYSDSGQKVADKLEAALNHVDEVEKEPDDVINKFDEKIEI